MTDKIFINAVKTLIANYFNNNGDKNEMYFDAYKKWKNMTVKEW